MQTAQRRPRRAVRRTEQRPSRLTRVLTGLLLGILLLCVAAAAVSYLINRNLPTASAQVETLSPIATAQTREILQLQATFGDQVWPGFGSAQIPVMVWNERFAFLCGYEGQPEGWQAVEKLEIDGQPCLRREWSNPQAFAEEVDGQWVGSMATQEWMSIRLQDQIRSELPPALAKVFPSLLVSLLGTERYMAGVVHESFHAFQAEVARPHFDDAELAYSSAESYWQADEQMRDAWKDEVDALYKAVRARSEDEARQQTRRFLELRAARRAEHLSSAPELIRFEQRFEWLEGLAKYVELETYRQASIAPDYEWTDELAPDNLFNAYSGYERTWSSELSTLRANANADSDVRFYYTGMAQAALLDRFAPGWKVRAFAPGTWLEDQLAQAVGK